MKQLKNHNFVILQQLRPQAFTYKMTI